MKFILLLLFIPSVLWANRSIQLNDEANLDVLDGSFAAQQTRLFEMDKQQSHEMTLDETGGLYLLQAVANFVSPQL